MGAPESGVAPPPQGGPAQGMPQPQQIGTTTVMPGGQPSMMGMGEPVTGKENFPIPYTPLKPFNEALQGLSKQGIGTPEGGGAGGEGGPNAIRLEEAQQILSGIDKLRGDVFLMGDIAQYGFAESKVDVGITSKLDRATIVNGTRGTKLYGRMAFTIIPAGEGPPPGAIPISGAAPAEAPPEAAPTAVPMPTPPPSEGAAPAPAPELAQVR